MYPRTKTKDGDAEKIAIVIEEFNDLSPSDLEVVAGVVAQITATGPRLRRGNLHRDPVSGCYITLKGDLNAYSDDDDDDDRDYLLLPEPLQSRETPGVKQLPPSTSPSLQSRMRKMNPYRPHPSLQAFKSAAMKTGASSAEARRQNEPKVQASPSGVVGRGATSSKETMQKGPIVHRGFWNAGSGAAIKQSSSSQSSLQPEQGSKVTAPSLPVWAETGLGGSMFTEDGEYKPLLKKYGCILPGSPMPRTLPMGTTTSRASEPPRSMKAPTPTAAAKPEPVFKDPLLTGEDIYKPDLTNENRPIFPVGKGHLPRADVWVKHWELETIEYARRSGRPQGSTYSPDHPYSRGRYIAVGYGGTIQEDGTHQVTSKIPAKAAMVGAESGAASTTANAEGSNRYELSKQRIPSITIGHHTDADLAAESKKASIGGPASVSEKIGGRVRRHTDGNALLTTTGHKTACRAMKTPGKSTLRNEVHFSLGGSEEEQEGSGEDCVSKSEAARPRKTSTFKGLKKSANRALAGKRAVSVAFADTDSVSLSNAVIDKEAPSHTSRPATEASENFLQVPKPKKRRRRRNKKKRKGVTVDFQGYIAEEDELPLLPKANGATDTSTGRRTSAEYAVDAIVGLFTQKTEEQSARKREKKTKTTAANKIVGLASFGAMPLPADVPTAAEDVVARFKNRGGRTGSLSSAVGAQRQSVEEASENELTPSTEDTKDAGVETREKRVKSYPQESEDESGRVRRATLKKLTGGVFKKKDSA